MALRYFQLLTSVNSVPLWLKTSLATGYNQWFTDYHHRDTERTEDSQRTLFFYCPLDTARNLFYLKLKNYFYELFILCRGLLGILAETLASLYFCIHYTHVQSKPNPHGVDARSISDTENAQVAHITLQPGEALKKHITPVDVVFYVLEGRGVVEIGEERTEVEADTLIESPAKR